VTTIVRSQAVLVDLRWIESIRPLLVTQLLQHWRPFFAEANLDLAPAAQDEAWRDRLHRLLNQAGPQMPASLSRALLDLHAVGNANSHETLLDLARTHGVRTMFPDGPLTTEELGVVLFIEQRELVTTAAARAVGEGERTYTEFNAGASASLPHCLEQSVLLVRTTLSSWFDARGRTDFCDVRAYETDDELRALVIHGTTPRRRGRIEKGKRRVDTAVFDRHDLIVYDKRRARLGLQGETTTIQDLYRRTFGLALFGSEDHFPRQALYEAAPLAAHGVASLLVDGVPNLEGVRLTGLVVRGVGRSAALGGHDLFAEDEDAIRRLVLERGDVVEMKFVVKVKGLKERTVTISGSNKLRCRPDVRDVVEEFLMVRGFMVLCAASRKAASTREVAA
jgi:hypothetical protein